MEKRQGEWGEDESGEEKPLPHFYPLPPYLSLFILHLGLSMG